MRRITIDLRRFGALLALLLAAAVAVSLVAATKPAQAATTFTVNSTGDDYDLNFPPGSSLTPDGKCDVDADTTGDQCTLRAAIQEANATPGADVINFNIPGAGPHTITLNNSLPQITEAVSIEGYTEPDSSANTLVDATQGTNAKLMIELDGGAVGNAGLDINTPNVVVNGLAIHSFTWGILTSSAATNLRIEGNFIGTDTGGIQDKGNSTGIEIASQNFTVGGETPAARNLISGNNKGIHATGANVSGAEVKGNLIGTQKDGKSPLPHDSTGVEFDSTGGNNSVGGLTIGSANTIAFNGDRGVVIFGDNAQASVLRNSIFSNAGEGISLPLTFPNDPLDADTGPNGGQNFPVITSAKTGRRATTINGTLHSKPNQIYTVMFFSHPEDDREGKTFKGQKSDVITNDAGNATFSVKLKRPNKIPKGQFVTATATASNGDTSEFSVAQKVG